MKKDVLIQIKVDLYEQGDYVRTPNGVAMVTVDEIFEYPYAQVWVRFKDRVHAEMKYGMSLVKLDKDELQLIDEIEYNKEEI